MRKSGFRINSNCHLAKQTDFVMYYVMPKDITGILGTQSDFDDAHAQYRAPIF